MTWYIEKVTQELDATIAKLRTELEENDKQEALFKPAASELESMRRLQSNKVNDVDLLDRLVGRGEEWLVLTMHRLDYFERAGLAPNDYPAWCEHALIGAYDWIDAGRLHASKRMFSLQGGATGPMRAVRPSDLAAINAAKIEATGQMRAEPAAPKPALQRPEPAAPKPAQAIRVPEGIETNTQPVPTIAQPAPASGPPAPEQIAKIETAPLPPPPARAEPRQPAPAPASQRPPVQPASLVADAPTRPTPVPASAQELTAPARPGPAAPTPATAQRSGQVIPPAASATPPPQRRPEPLSPAMPLAAGAPPTQPPQRRAEQPAPAARPQAQQLAAAQPGPAQPPYAPQKARQSSWNYQEQRPDPRYSLDDVEVEDLEEEGDDQGLLRKIFRVFTG